jgi:hypothetical protein
MESWCHDATNPVAVASVDLNTPCEHPSAIAVVSVAAPAAATDAVEAVTKAGGRRATKLGKSISAPASPSELNGHGTALGVQKKSKWTGKRPVSQRENHIWSERQRRKGMNYLFSTLRSLLPHPTSKVVASSPASPRSCLLEKGFVSVVGIWFTAEAGTHCDCGCGCRRTRARWWGRSSSTSSRCR